MKRTKPVKGRPPRFFWCQKHWGNSKKALYCCFLVTTAKSSFQLVDQMVNQGNRKISPIVVLYRFSRVVCTVVLYLTGSWFLHCDVQLLGNFRDSTYSLHLSKIYKYRFIYLFVLYSEISDRFPENGGNRYGSAPETPCWCPSRIIKVDRGIIFLVYKCFSLLSFCVVWGPWAWLFEVKTEGQTTETENLTIKLQFSNQNSRLS